MNAGKAPPAVAGPTRSPANFECKFPLVEQLRPPLRGKQSAECEAAANGAA